jgi:hypothetical protein
MSPGMNQIPAKLTQTCCKILRIDTNKLINFTWNKEEWP